MKKAFFFAAIISIVFSCGKSAKPKEVAQEFIQAVYSADGAKASSLATAKTQAVISQPKGDAGSIPVEESFSFSTLNETVSGNTAEVKNDLIKLTLEKENDHWKVAATPELIEFIANRQANLNNLKVKWDVLLKEYESRLQLAKDYIQYKKGLGALSPQLQTLEEMTNMLSVKTVWDKEKILLYVQRQKQLEDLIDKALEPSYTANSDISMNYFLQLNNAGDRIEQAQIEYQSLAEKTPSSTYPPLPFKTINSAKVN